VDERERRGEPRVAQVGEVARELRRRQHPLVDERPRGEARDREVGAGGELGDAADHVELALERVLVARQLRRGGDDDLADPRLVPGRRLPGDGLVHGHVAPADEALALGRDGVGEELLELGCTPGVAGEEDDADAVGSRGRQLPADGVAEERVRQLDQDPRAVAGLGIGPGRAAVLHVDERGEGALQRLVGGDPVQARDEGDAAGVVLVGGVVEPDPLHAVLPSLCGLVRRDGRGEPASREAGARRESA
jgi:hypothetical protein